MESGAGASRRLRYGWKTAAEHLAFAGPNAPRSPDFSGRARRFGASILATARQQRDDLTAATPDPPTLAICPYPIDGRGHAPRKLQRASSAVGSLLAEVKATFASTRLLTLVGPGGVGKTRLALRAGADLQRTVRDGVWFIDLAGLEDPHLVAKAVISGLGVADQSGQWPTSLLVSHLASREAMLILDNCEHLLDAVAVLADVVLKEAAGVRLLATSRQALGIAGERVVQVPPLTLQGEPGAETAQGAAHSEAVALLVARATDAGVQLEETAATRQLLLDVCRRLDGMPLALELAAVRLRTIGLDQLLERLSDRFALLTGGSRVALPRQQTLRATID